MSDYQGINTVVSDGEENDWLEVSYANRKYVEENKPKPSVRNNKKYISVLKYTAMALVAFTVLAGLLFVDSNFDGNVFETARATFTSQLPVWQAVSNAPDGTIEIPYTMTVDNVDNGVVYLSGGRAVVSFTDGTVSQVGEDSLTVDIDENTRIVYSDLTAIYVTEGQEVTRNTLLAKYNDTATITILYNGEIVEDVVGSENSVQWSV